jgi:hypothetical protein
MRWRRPLTKLNRARARLERHTQRNHGNILKQKNTKPRAHSHRHRNANPGFADAGHARRLSAARSCRHCDNGCYSIISRIPAASAGSIVSPVALPSKLTGPPGSHLWRGTALADTCIKIGGNRPPKHREMQLVFWPSMRSKPPYLQLTHRLL